MQWDFKQMKKEKEGLEQRLAHSEQYAEEIEAEMESEKLELEGF